MLVSPKFVRAVAASDAPVPPLTTAKSVPLQLELLTVLSVAKEPSPNVVRALLAAASSISEAPKVEIVVLAGSDSVSQSRSHRWNS